MKTLAKISKAIARRIPGSAVTIATAKRKMEKELRAAGYSRAHAKGIVAEHFRNRG